MRAPEDLQYFQEWQRIVFDSTGNRVSKLDSGWYDEEVIARSLLNHPEYPNPTSTGWTFFLQTRWVSEAAIIT